MPGGFDPKTFEQLVSFFLVPLGILLFSSLLQRRTKGRMNAGVDLFVFLVSLDFAYLICSNRLQTRINPTFALFYGPLFGVMLVMSLVMLAYSANVQALVVQSLVGRQQHYPIGRVFVCWMLALSMIAFHLLVTIGG